MDGAGWCDDIGLYESEWQLSWHLFVVLVWRIGSRYEGTNSFQTLLHKFSIVSFAFDAFTMDYGIT